MADPKSAKLKHLQVLVNSTKADIAQKQKELSGYEKEIKQLKAKKIIVSEHSMLRYLQRVYKLDLKKIEDEILNESVKTAVQNFGDGKYTVGEFTVRVKNNILLTVV